MPLLSLVSLYIYGFFSICQQTAYEIGVRLLVSEMFIRVRLNSLLVSSFMFSPSLSIVSFAAPFSKPMQTRGSTWFSRTPCAHEVLLYGGSEPRRGVMTDGAPQPQHIRGPDGGICVSLELATHGFQENAHTHSGFFVRLFWFVQFCVQV